MIAFKCIKTIHVWFIKRCKFFILRVSLCLPNLCIVKFFFSAIVDGRGLAQGEVGIASIDQRSPELQLSQFSDSSSYSRLFAKILQHSPSEVSGEDAHSWILFWNGKKLNWHVLKLFICFYQCIRFQKFRFYSRTLLVNLEKWLVYFILCRRTFLTAGWLRFDGSILTIRWECNAFNNSVTYDSKKSSMTLMESECYLSFWDSYNCILTRFDYFLLTLGGSRQTLGIKQQMKW